MTTREGSASSSSQPDYASPTVAVRTRGHVTPQEAEYAREKVASVLRYARDPVLQASVRLTRLVDPALERPVIAQVNVDLNGRMLRAQAARATVREAVDEVHDRIRDRVLRAAGDWEAIRGGRPVDEPHEWRHQSRPAERLPSRRAELEPTVPLPAGATEAAKVPIERT